EQSLLHHVLHAARGERRAPILLLLRQFLAQPGHRPIEMMQIEPLHAGDGVVLARAIGGAVGAAHEQPVQHSEEHRTLQREAVLAFARELRDHRPAAGLLPQPLEHQRWSDPMHGDLERRIVVGRAQHHGLGRKARARAHQPFQLAASLQRLETPERGDHLLAHLLAVAAALDDLQIGAPGRGLAAEGHGGDSRAGAHTESRFDQEIKLNQLKTWHYTFAKTPPRIKQNQGLMPLRPPPTVEDRASSILLRSVEDRWSRTVIEGKVIHIPDAQNDPEYTMRDLIKLDPFRTMLGVPLLREGNPIGVISLTRATVRPFTKQESQLVTTFADQAVIAI